MSVRNSSGTTGQAFGQCESADFERGLWWRQMYQHAGSLLKYVTEGDPYETVCLWGRGEDWKQSGGTGEMVITVLEKKNKSEKGYRDWWEGYNICEIRHNLFS